MPSGAASQQNRPNPVSVCSHSATALKVKIGDMLQLQLLEHPDRGRFHVSVIGLHEGRNLIISAPMSNGNLLMLREGQMFVVRSLAGKQVLGFSAEVVKCYMNPYPYVHLRIPGDIEQYDVRNAYRVDVQLIASVTPVDAETDTDNANSRKTGQSLPAIVQNISTTGCLIKMPKPLDESANGLILSLRVDVAQHSRTMKINAGVCSHREQHDADDEQPHHLYGLRFDDMEDDRRLMLYCFVYEKIAHQIYSD